MALHPQALAKAIGCWLEYEAAIGRAPLFDEAYLSYPLGAVLLAHGDGKILPEEPHPMLAGDGAGAKAAVDYAVADQGGAWTLAIESKFVTDSRDFAPEIFADVLRLEALVEKFPAARRLLVLAGRYQEIKALLVDRKGQQGGGGALLPLFPTVLSIDSSAPALTSDISASTDPHRGYWKDSKPKKLAGWPPKLTTTLVGKFADEGTPASYACVVWEVTSITRTLLPNL